MKFVLIAVLVGVLALCTESHNLGEKEAFEAFKLKHDKSYGNKAEEVKRFKVWQKNLKKIREHNARYEAGEVTFFLGENQFSDMTLEEYRQTLSGKVQFPKDAESYSVNYRVASPQSIDWRSKGAVTEVKDQGNCGSCWAFSTMVSIEGQFFRKNGTLVSFSEQQLVDCSKRNGGCHGGWMVYAFKDLKESGLETLQSYPYVGEDQTCTYSEDKAYMGPIKGYVALPQGDEVALTSSIATVGPISVAIDASADSFKQYAGGIYDEPACSSEYADLDHGVAAVGFGVDDKGNEYYIVKNSWSETWGEKGYIKMPKNKQNKCGIANAASFPRL